MLALAMLVAGCGAGSGSVPIVPPAPPPAASIDLPMPVPIAPRPAPAALQARLDDLMRAFPGKAGAAIQAVDENWAAESGGTQLLPQQSVSKLWVAITVLDQRDAGRLRLDQPVTVTREDLTLFHQPIASLVARGPYTTTVADLMFRAMTQSDNTANDRLLTLVGGPTAVRRMIAAKSLGAIRFGPGERLLQAGTAGLIWNQSMASGRGFEAARARLPMATRIAALDRYTADPPDGAAPAAITAALARLARGELLSETSTRLLLSTMAASRTGHARLRAATPPGWQLSHKTGTGQDLGGRNAGLNDVGLLTSPDGRRYAVAVQIGDTRAPIRDRQVLIQRVASLVTGAQASAAIGGDEPEN